MATTNLDIDVLRSFAAVADCGSFTAAGALVARTQSAISLQIKRLEESVGHKVFERTSRALALTSAGETLLGYARRILELNDESVRRIAEPPLTGVIRLGITEYFVPAEQPRILSRFAMAYPGVQLEARMGLSHVLRKELAAGRLDAGIVKLARHERTKAIWSEAHLWVAPEGWVSERGKVVPLALLPPPCLLRRHALESMKRLRRPCKVTFTGSNMAGVQAAVSAGLGVSILPRSLIAPGIQLLPNSRDYPDAGPLNIGVLRRPGARNDVVDALERVIRQTLDVLAVRVG
jgi:DNA-binding transcriptional LysR family regulator